MIDRFGQGTDLSQSALKGTVKVEELCQFTPLIKVHQMISHYIQQWFPVPKKPCGYY